MREPEEGWEAQARSVLERCREARVRLALAEACSGGLIAARLTAVPGASAVLERAFVPYSNESKEDLLGVPGPLMREHGAVSAEVVQAMAEGLLARTPVELVLAETGIAGPGGGSPLKPVGLVFLACARRGGAVKVERHVFPGNRAEVRHAIATRGLALLLEGFAEKS
ncbi:CinA family protein [Stigmatella aurantiaca]|uniref:CinA, C-terminal n=1 Tax=Stigmatella aurantiaca (strain DW4/3-1) TaxID=378806 RepID=Q097U1_STIAD|nr:CinA family protein [Stigmatella aurantiaca]ADO68440.1 Competence/damage-inducible protein, CinA domain protein [Stigmatella aurantiaca DW4/3-1]EAU68011.1 CinA, C-terminal [Stigmatella aurantiaca DW4/3-1]